MVVTEFKGLKSDEKLMLVLLLGALDALHQNKINTDEVQKILPLDVLEGIVNPKVQDLMEEAWQLDDAKDFGVLDESIEDMKKKTLELLSKYDDYSDHRWLGFSFGDREIM